MQSFIEFFHRECEVYLFIKRADPRIRTCKQVVDKCLPGCRIHGYTRTDGQGPGQQSRQPVAFGISGFPFMPLPVCEQFIQRIRAPKCAAAAKAGVYGNDSIEATYPMTRVDADGDTLDGRSSSGSLERLQAIPGERNIGDGLLVFAAVRDDGGKALLFRRVGQRLQGSPDDGARRL